MEFGPIWRSTLRNALGPLLIALQIALTLAVVANAVFVAQQRIAKINRPTGLDVDNIVVVTSRGFDEDFDVKDTVRRDLEALQAIDGVRAATFMQAVPLSGGGWGTTLAASPQQDAPSVSLSQYFVNDKAVAALGLTLESGRDFTPDDVRTPEPFQPSGSDKVIVTRALLDALFPDGAGPGAAVYNSLGTAYQVVGVVERMQGPWGADESSWARGQIGHVMFRPILLPNPETVYAVRTEPGQRDAVMAEVEETLAGSDAHRVVKDLRPLTEVKARNYSTDRGMAILLTVVTLLMITVTVVGIVGLASFNVRRRTRQIGTRRAVGARRRDIVRYFMVENWMITTTGVTVGAVLAFGMNYWLTTTFGLSRIDPLYVPGGMIALWLLGLLAVAAPARWAAAVSPAVATRTV